MSYSYLWIKDDLRVRNNQALTRFLEETNKNKKALYFYDRKSFETRTSQRWWLSNALAKFTNKIENLNVNLDIIYDDIEDYIAFLVKKKKISSIFWNKSLNSSEKKSEKKVKNILTNNNIKIFEFSCNLLNQFDVIKKDDGTPFKVFTPYWKKAEQIYLRNPFQLQIKEEIIKFDQKETNNDKNLDQIMPNKKWFKKFEKYWNTDENTAHKIIDEFTQKKIEKYGVDRDIPGIEGTSKISPYLAFGQISIHIIFKKCLDLKKKGLGYRKYINELGWREFSNSLLHNFPSMENENLKKEFNNFPWIKNSKLLTDWKTGQTGYPIVDAGMRELYETGWMHNRVRMITASFLVKHLRIHWKEGETYFRDSLLDFNAANNVAGWQWVAGTGADAAPYFRIFNPIIQGEKFDPDGSYVRRWCPELKKVPKEYIHRPWEMNEDSQNRFDAKIGKIYPSPIVNHEQARKAALDSFQQLKK